MSLACDETDTEFLSATLTAIAAYPFTMVWWDLIGAGAGGFNGFVSLSDSGDPTNYYIDTHINGTGASDRKTNVVLRAAGSSVTMNGTDSQSEDAWAQKVIAKVAVADQDLYVNDGTIDHSGSSKNVIGSSGLDAFEVGRGRTYGAFLGNIAEVAIWLNHELTATEITDLQTKTPNNIGNDPDYYWPLVSNGNATLGGVNLTENGTITWASGTHPSLTGPSAGGVIVESVNFIGI